jgi:gluconate 2-dehydrogenase gamma chain
MKSDTPVTPPRRNFLRQIITVASAAPLSTQLVGAVGLTAASGAALAADATAPAAASLPLEPGYQSFSGDESAFTESMVNIMCPADKLSPNGVDSGLALFIDRQLAGPFGKGVRRYMQGPWRQGKPEQGPQLPLTPEQFYKTGIAVANQVCQTRFGKTFDMLAAADGDAFLHDIAAGKVDGQRISLASWFNDLVYPLFTQACFADPLYGGNNGKVFWKMIGYPGLPATHHLDIVNFRGKPYPGAKDPKSIADFS